MGEASKLEWEKKAAEAVEEGEGGGGRKAGKLGWERGGFKYFCTLAELSLAGFY